MWKIVVKNRPNVSNDCFQCSGEQNPICDETNQSKLSYSCYRIDEYKIDFGELVISSQYIISEWQIEFCLMIVDTSKVENNFVYS